MSVMCFCLDEDCCLVVDVDVNVDETSDDNADKRMTFGERISSYSSNDVDAGGPASRNDAHKDIWLFEVEIGKGDW